MFEDDRSYYQHRAKVEAERAQQATTPDVVRIHSELAKAYLGRLTSGESRQDRRIMIQAQQREPSSAGRIVTRAPSRLKGTRPWTIGLLSGEEQEALAQVALPARTVGPGIDLVREAEPADSVFILVEGWACRYTTTREGGRQLPALSLPGDVANLDTLMFDRLDYGVRTITAATIVALPRDRLLALGAQHPGIARLFLWLALAENVILGQWTLSLGRRSAKERLAHLLCELGVRLGRESGDESSFACPLTQEQLADVLGLTSIHVNRTMQQLRADGLLVTSQRTVTLPDLPRLRRLGGFDPRYLHLHSPAETRFA